MKVRQFGEIGAVLASVWIGMTAILVSHMWSVANPLVANQVLLRLGSWIPGWWGIGPYAGKETVGLIGWLLSWGILHFLLRKREFQLQKWMFGFLCGFLLVVILLWPPVIHFFFGWLPNLPG
ncbi:MAG: hypothetical protein H7X86_14005 [Gorillibacterium sp.]|nr:hypothetical protein [Gorillibacterium sp.]